jgi:hypothetical protein
MKLTLELDNGKTNTIRSFGGGSFAGDRLKTLQDMCVLLDHWASERDKQEDKNNG